MDPPGRAPSVHPRYRRALGTARWRSSGCLATDSVVSQQSARTRTRTHGENVLRASSKEDADKSAAPPPFCFPDMTLFGPRYMSMSGELKSSRSRAASKRTSNTIYGSEFDLDYDSYHDDYYDRVYDYQRVPASLSPLPLGPSLAKRSRSSSHSSGHRRSRDRTHSKSSRAHSTSSTAAKLGMEELQVIKKELTLIKTQIDGLLDSLDRMDTQKNDHKGSPLREHSPVGSPYALSASPERSLSPPSSRHRIHRESPDPREPDDGRHTMSNHSSDPEEEI
ncbi:heterogeneous nuclear ribonucleoprotein C [Betta splendens]|uniref:Heterogeneous nuclear ribonucleoprotein C n=1 Tax=Betta splendens TaxID=158456 RepID=A0A6P7M0F8_BETSP|nr:heterogeneous nuclear ribonucleoprotein C [Betta splendens]